MNPIYEQLQMQEDKDYLDAVKKFLEAANAFEKLTQQQKAQFCREMQIAAILREMTYGGYYG